MYTQKDKDDKEEEAHNVKMKEELKLKPPKPQQQAGGGGGGVDEEAAAPENIRPRGSDASVTSSGVSSVASSWSLEEKDNYQGKEERRRSPIPESDDGDDEGDGDVGGSGGYYMEGSFALPTNTPMARAKGSSSPRKIKKRPREFKHTGDEKGDDTLAHTPSTTHSDVTTPMTSSAHPLSGVGVIVPDPSPLTSQGEGGDTLLVPVSPRSGGGDVSGGRASLSMFGEDQASVIPIVHDIMKALTEYENRSSLQAPQSTSASPSPPAGGTGLPHTHHHSQPSEALTLALDVMNKDLPQLMAKRRLNFEKRRSPGRRSSGEGNELCTLQPSRADGEHQAHPHHSQPHPQRPCVSGWTPGVGDVKLEKDSARDERSIHHRTSPSFQSNNALQTPPHSLALPRPLKSPGRVVEVCDCNNFREMMFDMGLLEPYARRCSIVIGQLTGDPQEYSFTEIEEAEDKNGEELMEQEGEVLEEVQGAVGGEPATSPELPIPKRRKTTKSKWYSKFDMPNFMSKHWYRRRREKDKDECDYTQLSTPLLRGGQDSDTLSLPSTISHPSSSSLLSQSTTLTVVDPTTPRHSPQPSPNTSQPSPQLSPQPSPRPYQQPSPRPYQQPSPRHYQQPSPHPSPQRSPRHYQQPSPYPSPQPSPRHYQQPSPYPSPQPSPYPSPQPSPRPKTSPGLSKQSPASGGSGAQERGSPRPGPCEQGLLPPYGGVSPDVSSSSHRLQATRGQPSPSGSFGLIKLASPSGSGGAGLERQTPPKATSPPSPEPVSVPRRSPASPSGTSQQPGQSAEQHYSSSLPVQRRCDGQGHPEGQGHPGQRHSPHSGRGAGPGNSAPRHRYSSGDRRERREQGHHTMVDLKGHLARIISKFIPPKTTVPKTTPPKEVDSRYSDHYAMDFSQTCDRARSAKRDASYDFKQFCVSMKRCAKSEGFSQTAPFMSNILLQALTSVHLNPRKDDQEPRASSRSKIKAASRRLQGELEESQPGSPSQVDSGGTGHVSPGLGSATSPSSFHFSHVTHDEREAMLEEAGCQTQPDAYDPNVLTHFVNQVTSVKDKSPKYYSRFLRELLKNGERLSPPGWINGHCPETGFTLLMMAVLANNLPLVQILLHEFGADPNVAMDRSPYFTALHLACLHAATCDVYTTMVVVCLGGGNVNQEAEFGLTPIDLAIISGCRHLAVLYDVFDNLHNGHQGNDCEKKEDDPGKEEDDDDPRKNGDDTGKKGDDPGKMGDDTGKKGEDPGKMGGDPGKMGGDPGKMGGDPGKMGGDPGKMGGDPGKMGGDPGKMGGDPGKNGDDPGKNSNDPKKNSDDPKKKTDHPGTWV